MFICDYVQGQGSVCCVHVDELEDTCLLVASPTVLPYSVLAHAVLTTLLYTFIPSLHVFTLGPA